MCWVVSTFICRVVTEPEPGILYHELPAAMPTALDCANQPKWSAGQESVRVLPLTLYVMFVRLLATGDGTSRLPGPCRCAGVGPHYRHFLWGFPRVIAHCDFAWTSCCGRK